MIEIAIPLQQTEAARGLVEVRADARRGGIAQRPPDPFALAGADRQPVGVVDLGSPVVREAPIVLAALVHACQRRNPKAADCLARIDGSVHFHNLRSAGCECEAISAGRAHRVEQAVKHERARSGLRTLEPECDEAWKFLDVVRGVDGEPARRETELSRVAAARTEIARAEKHRDVLAPVRRRVHAKSCEGQVGGKLARVDAAVCQIEHLGTVANFARRAVDDFVQGHRFLEAPTAVEKLQAKRALRLRPERVIVTKADRLVLVVRQVAQELRCELFRRAIRCFRQCLRASFQRCVVEGRGSSSEIGSRERREQQRGFQEVASSHEDA
jgi:hypothetical protein